MNVTKLLSKPYDKLKSLRITPSIAVLIYIAILLGVLILYGEMTNRSVILSLKEISRELNSEISNLSKEASDLRRNVSNLEKENEALKKEDARIQLKAYNEAVEKYEVVKEKSKDYKLQGVNIASVEKKLDSVVDFIFGRKYSKADKFLTDLSKQLDTLLKQKKAADAAKKAKAAPKKPACSSLPSSGYCAFPVKISSGTFTVDAIGINLSNATAVTDTAISSNCTNNCSTKSLQSYITSNNGFVFFL